MGSTADRAGAGRRGGAGGQRLIGIHHEEIGSVHGSGHGIDAGCIDGVLRIDLAVVADDELDDAVVVLVDHVEVELVGGDGFGHRIASAGGKRRGGNLAHEAGLGVDLEDVDLAVVVGSRGLGTGHEDKSTVSVPQAVTRPAANRLAAETSSELARFVELHAHLSSRAQWTGPKKPVWNRTRAV
jgi:hypothetical protein